MVKCVRQHLMLTVGTVLQVNISSNPVSDGGVYQAGSSVVLTCQANGGALPLTYYWNSTCDGSCFVLGEITQSVESIALHSRDSGIHICSVTDYVGNTGTATIQMTVSGNCCRAVSALSVSHHLIFLQELLSTLMELD